MRPLASRRAALALPALLLPAAAQAADPLPSWREGDTKRAILDFVAAVSTEGGAEFVPPAARIAVFDNDGTLWVEQPVYTQFLFILDRIRRLGPGRPDWQQDPLFRAAIAGDLQALGASGVEGLLTLAGTALAGNTPEEAQALAAAWLDGARDARWHRPYTQMVYRPMLELLALLRARGFTNFIVSGGGVEFVRAFAEPVYGIPPQQVVGSTFALQSGERDGRVVLTRTPRVDFVDDGPGKPVGIARHVGRRPIAGFGNSDGDVEMLHYATEAPGRRLGLLVRHDDAAREYAYDRASHIGRLALGLDEAPARGWQVASMRDDWTTIFA
jgi:phosphoserine phosphatase